MFEPGVNSCPVQFQDNASEARELPTILRW